MREFGAILLVLGLLGVYYFQFEFDTSINIEPGKNGYSKPYGLNEKDNNLGLLQDKKNYTYISIGTSVAGAILLVAGIRRNKAGR